MRRDENRPILPSLALALTLRAVLVLRGGQEYWPDEHRFARSMAFLERLRAADLHGLLDLLAAGDHTGFVVLGAVAAVPQYLAGTLFGSPWTTMWISALVMSLAGVAIIALVFAVSRRLGAEQDEALLAALLATASASLLATSRHLLPYDLSLATALLAAWLGLAPGASLRRAFTTGLVAGLAFLTYNGYWAAALLAALVPAIRARGARDRMVRAALSAAGFASWLALLAAVAALSGHPSYLASLRHFASTVRQGDLDAGPAIPLAYLWHAEHGLLVLWLAAGVVAAGLARRRALPGLGAALILYLVLAAGSAGLGAFVVYGRHARPLVPLLCLAAAPAVARLRGRMRGVALLALAVQAAVNFAPLLGQRFPREVAAELRARYGPLHEATTVGPASSLPVSPGSRYVLLNARHLHPVEAVLEAPPGRVLFRAAHPLEYRPSTYEGFTAAERRLLDSADISIRLIERDPPAQRSARTLPSGSARTSATRSAPASVKCTRSWK